MAGMQGKAIWEGEHKSMLFFSSHDVPEDIVVAQLGSLEDLKSSSNQCLPYKDDTNYLENHRDNQGKPKEEHIEEEDVLGFALQCALTYIPEVHLDAVMEIEDLDDDIFKMFTTRFRCERGSQKVCRDKTKRSVEWRRAVEKLADLDQFHDAVIAWASDEPSRGRWCWPPTFEDEQIARKTAVSVEAFDAQMKEERERANLGADIQIITNLNKEAEDDLATALTGCVVKSKACGGETDGLNDPQQRQQD